MGWTEIYRSRVTTAEAALDVERFFYLLEHGYCGYGFFSQDDSFDSSSASTSAA